MNRGGAATINNPELAALFAQVQIFDPAMDTLAQIHTSMDNTDTHGWANCGSVSTLTAVGPILRDLALLTRTLKIHSSVRRIAGTDNKMADAASRLTYLTDKIFLCHFALTIPQRKSWQLLTLPSGYKRRLTSTLHIKRCRVAFPPQFTRKTQPPGANGASSANGWESQPTSKASDIPSLFSRSSQSACAPAFWKTAGYPPRSAQWNSTFIT